MLQEVSDVQFEMPKEHHHVQITGMLLPNTNTGYLSNLGCVLISCPLKPPTGMETTHPHQLTSTLNDFELMVRIWT